MLASSLVLMMLAAPGALASGSGGLLQPVSAEGEDDFDDDTFELSLEELGQVEIITTTARKREENMQETPVAITALSQGALRERGVWRVDDLARYVPNLTLDNGAVHGASIYIRGVGQRDTRQFIEPGVGVYLDGVYLSQAQAALLPIVDVDRIEVLRGPQGTLYGRNTIGGAVKYVSNQPEPEFETELEVRGGSLGMVGSRLAVNIPMLDDLLYGRVAFASNHRNGFARQIDYTNDPNGELARRWDNEGMFAVAPSLRMEPMDNLTLDLRGYWTMQDKLQRGSRCVLVDPNNPKILGMQFAKLVDPVTAADNPDLLTSCMRDMQRENFYDFSASASGDYTEDTHGIASTIDYDPGGFWVFEDINLKNIAAWMVQNSTAFGGVDMDSTDQRVLEQNVIKPNKITNISEELTITTSTTMGQLLPFLPESMKHGLVTPTMGMFFSWEESREGLEDNTQVGGGGPLFLPILNPFLPAPNPLDPADYILFPAHDPNGANTIFNSPQITNSSKAWYTQWTFETWDYIHLTGGIRYTDENKQTERFDPGAESVESNAYSRWTPMANVNFLAPDSWLEAMRAETAIFYYTYSAGFKSGGINETTDVRTGDTLPEFGPEDLTSHEIGLKLNLFENRMLFNLALFYNDYEDMQVTVTTVDPVTGNLGARIANAGEAEIKGLEVEIVAVPIKHFDINLAFGLQDPKYIVFNDFLPDGSPVDRSDEPFNNVSKYNVHVGAQYTLYLNDFLSGGNWGRLTPRVDYNWTSERNYHLTRAGFESGLFVRPDLGLLDVRLTWQSTDERYSAGFFMTNATDEKYLNSAVDVSDFFGTAGVRFGTPQMWGFEVGFVY